MPAPGPHSTSVTLPDRSIAKCAQDAGFSGDDLVTAVAVALAESGGVTDKISATGDYGVWQINWNAHQELFTTHDWWDGTANAQMAYSIWERGGWHPWTTWKDHKHEQYLDRARAAAADPGNPTNVGETTREAQWFRDTKDALGKIANAMAAIAQKAWQAAGWMAKPHNWVRMALVMLGSGLLIGAMVVVSKPVISPVASTAVKAVKTAQKVAK